MNYWKATSDLKVVTAFAEDVYSLWNLEDQVPEGLWDETLLSHERQAAIQAGARTISGYQEVRSRVSGDLSEVIAIGRINRVPLDISSYPPAAVGGPVIPVNMLQIVLQDNTWGGITRQHIIDGLDMLKAACLKRKKREFRNLFNPFHWVAVLLDILLKVPFWLISKTGFNVSKIEDQVWGKVFKLLEVLLFLWMAIKLGFTKEQLQEIFIKLKP